MYDAPENEAIKLLDKGINSLYLTTVVPSVTKLVSVEGDGAPFTFPSVSAPFYGYLKP